MKYNLFRQATSMALGCAVPEDRAVPAFLQSERWEFLGKVDVASARLWGFNDEAAETGFLFNGFHLFQEIKAPNGQVQADATVFSERSPALDRRSHGTDNIDLHPETTARTSCLATGRRGPTSTMTLPPRTDRRPHGLLPLG